MSSETAAAAYLPGVDRLRPFGDASYLDVTQEPFNADPSGQRDATDALVRAIDAVVKITADAQAATVKEIEALPGDGHLPSGVENRKENGRVKCIFPSFLPYLPAIYLPAGVYRVSDTVSYSIAGLTNSLGAELNRQIRLIGDGPAHTIIRLDDAAAGFDGPEPKPVVSVMRGSRSNVSMSNYVQAMTIETGRGNPAAIGLDFFANNSGAARDLVIRSGDGAGHAGVQLNHGSLSGAIVEDVRVEGFDTGLSVSGGYVVAEAIMLSNQRKQGIHTASASLSLRDITMDAAVPALVCDDPRGSTVLVDSALRGAGPCAIDCRSGALYVADVKIQGFDAAVGGQAAGDVPADAIEQAGGAAVVRELALPRAFAFASEGSFMPRLPVQRRPKLEPLGANETRCGVRAFGARGDGRHDDGPAIQQALDSGAAEVVFEPGHYMLDAPVTIPAGVRHIDFRFVDLVAGPTLATMTGQGAFVIEGESDVPLHLEALFAWELWRGEHHTFEHACRRTVVIRDMHTQTSPLYHNSVTGGKVFIDNICCTTGVKPGATGHARACVSFHGQDVWTRQLNPERGEPMALNDGGNLWVLGFKTEDWGIAFHTINGGRSEILGGMLNSGRPHATAFVNDQAQARLTGATSGGVPEGYYGVAVEERQGEQSWTLPADELPSRGYAPERGRQWHLPLFKSAAR